MRWKQFFTPVETFDAEKAKGYIKERSLDDVEIIDVRQPKEYEEGHIPGAKLLPLPDLDKRIDEIDPDKPKIVYCAIGGRSRVAAQMLAGKGMSKVINLSGGFKAWNGGSAFGGELQGLELFSGDESLEHSLAVAYSLEEGLRDFYLSMIARVKTQAAKDLFKKLSDIEVKHQERIYKQYTQITKSPLSKDEFVKTMVAGAVEGGMTTREYIDMFKPDLESTIDIIEIAMSIEAQALDLYRRASESSKDETGKAALSQIADEERAHLNQLGQLIENI